MMIDRRVAGLVLIMLLAIGFAEASAQANVGAGPLTGALPDTEPTTGVLHFGRVRVAPGLTIRELGWDSNVFDEPENPKEDYVASLLPDASAFTGLRFLRLSVYGGGDLRYYKTYSQERSTGYITRGRADILMSRLRPFVAGGITKMRTRPNGEIDVRADRKETEVSGGLAFDVSRYGQIYGSTYRHTTQFIDAFERGIELGPALDHDSDSYSVGVRSEITPLTALTVSASYIEDSFRFTPERDATARALDATVRIGAEAVVTGFATVSFRDFTPVDPRLRRFRGVTGRGGIVYPFLEIGRISVQFSRGTEYSFQQDEGFYLENSVTLNYTHRLAGNIDVNVTGSKSVFDYRFVTVLPSRHESFDSVGGGVGYNLPNRTRISVNYEYARRRSPELPERNYDRRRAYLAWTFAF